MRHHRQLSGVGGRFDAAGFESGEAAVGAGLQAVLVSPHFLFRGELQPDPDNPNVTRPVDQFALASRMSYFLWSSMPDEELFMLAERGHLRRNLEAQVARMLRDPKVRALSENFAGQWLQLRNLGLAAPDPREFPGFDEELRRSMRRETELLFETILREDHVKRGSPSWSCRTELRRSRKAATLKKSR